MLTQALSWLCWIGDREVTIWRATYSIQKNRSIHRINFIQMKYGDRFLALGMGPIPAQNCHHATNSGHGFRWSWTISPNRSLEDTSDWEVDMLWILISRQCKINQIIEIHHPTHGYDVFTGMIFLKNIGFKTYIDVSSQGVSYILAWVLLEFDKGSYVGQSVLESQTT